jgi:WD40 repeat protein
VFSPHGRHIVCVSDDKLLLWEVATGREVARFADHPRPTKWVVSGSRDKTLRLWDVASGQAILLTGHTDEVSAVAFSPDGQHVVSGSSDKTLRVWDASGGSEIGRLVGHNGGVLAAAFAPDGRHIVSGSSGQDRPVVGGDGWARAHSLRGRQPVPVRNISP